MAKRREEPGTERHRGRVLGGRSSQRGADFDPGAPIPQAAAPVEEVRTPRPSTTRFPIDVETYMALKAEAADRRRRRRAKPGSTVVADRPRRGPELASMPAAAMAPPEMAAAVAPPLPGAPLAAPAPGVNFAGIPATGWLPPDCTMAAGPNHVMASVNSSVALFRKTGGPALFQRTLTTWFANVVQNATIFDPKLLFDQHHNRWVLVAVSRAQSPNRSSFLLSVSKTADPLGPWSNYAVDAMKDGTTATNNWADYPGVGVDSQAIYLTANMFRFGGAFAYAKVRIIPKAGPYSGGAITFRDIVRLKNADGSLAFTVQPCHTYGAPQVEYLVNSLYPTGASPVQSRISLWSLRDPLGTPALTVRTVATDPYGLPPDAAQKGGGTPLDSGDVRMLNAVFRGGSVWTALTTQHSFGGAPVAAAHWFQVNAATGALTQQGIYGANRFHYFYPAVMPDSNGNMTMVFSRCGTTEFASIHFTGRRASDPLGVLAGSVLLKAGLANYTGLDGFGRNRWGDYAGIAVDPANGRLVWFYSMSADSASVWATRVGSASY